MLMLGVLITASFLSPAFGDIRSLHFDRAGASSCARTLHAEFAQPAKGDGLVTSSPDLTPENVLVALEHGAFPWEQDANRTYWFRPHKRGVLKLEPLLWSNPNNLFNTSTNPEIRWDRTILTKLKRQQERGRLVTTRGEDFDEIIEACARQERRFDNWITPEFRRVYKKLHEMGYAYSRGIYRDGKLVAGFYGTYYNGSFMGESMFHDDKHGKNLLKLLLVDFAEELYALGHRDIDTQVVAGLVKKWGGYEMTAQQFGLRQARLKRANLPFPDQRNSNAVTSAVGQSE